MGWAEELHELAEAATTLWICQAHSGLRQILQEPALLLDLGSWTFRKFLNMYPWFLMMLFI
jgi:hypothetical protein